MLPVIAIIGRPNVGKSTLFNRLTKTRSAIVCDLPGMTRDRQFGDGVFADHHFIVVDTGGLGEIGTDIEAQTAKQAWQAAAEADIILFLVDARSGLISADEIIASKLRKLGKKTYLVVNKIDGIQNKHVLTDFYALGFGELYPISSEHGNGLKDLLATVVQSQEWTDIELKAQQDLVSVENTPEDRIKIAFVGRPNVGKSTLFNRILGEERMIVSDFAGTTRDSIFVDFERHGAKYTLIDTAGIRRRTHVKVAEEKFSIVKALQSIEACNVVIIMFDAREAITDQDLRLLGFVLESGKALVVAVNKWDGLSIDQRDKIRKDLDRRLDFVNFAEIHFISALHGTAVGNLFASIKRAYLSATRHIKTPEATRILEAAVKANQPPMVSGRRIKLRYAHIGGNNPPVIVVHGNQTEKLPGSYVRYLENYYRKVLKLVGTPIRIELKSSINPYRSRKMDS